MKATNRSPFAEVLARILKHPNGYTPREWSKVLGVTPSAVSQWLSDTTIPRASTLRNMRDLAIWLYGAEEWRQFEKIAKRPAETVSPHGERMQPTISHYMVEPIREGFLRLLRTLPPPAQEEVLFDASDACRAKLRAALTQNSPDVTKREASISQPLVEAFVQGQGTHIERLNKDDAALGSGRRSMEGALA